jgi:hypothetical protein
MALDNEELRREVREWLCAKCRHVFDGPPAEGVACVICTLCGGPTGPMNSVLLREEKALSKTLALALKKRVQERHGCCCAGRCKECEIEESALAQYNAANMQERV